MKIFDDGIPVSGRKASSAVTAGHPLVRNRLWPDFDFDDLVERIGVRAVEMNPRGFGHHSQPRLIRHAKLLYEIPRHHCRTCRTGAT